MERPVKETHFGSHAGLPARDQLFVRDSHEPRSYPTPAEFVAQVGRVLAVCFGLALLAHVIVTAIGLPSQPAAGGPQANSNGSSASAVIAGGTLKNLYRVYMPTRSR
jgi:hypothetical protein